MKIERHIYREAKQFAREVKAATGLALRPDDELVDSLSDEELEAFVEQCKSLGITRRPDGRWEAK